MKKIIYTSVILVFMIIITSIGFFPSLLTFLIAQGSDCLLILDSSNVLLQLFFIVLIILSLFFREKIRKNLSRLIIITLVIMWIISGRVIGHIPWPDDKIITGWFCIPLSKIYMCNSTDDNIDCEALIYKTIVKKKPFWFILLKNEKREKLIFVGPIIWEKTINSFQKIYGTKEQEIE